MKRTMWTTELVLAWIAEHRPDFEVAEGWVHVNNKTPIPGRCLVEGCGAECAPTMNHMKDSGQGHCIACARRAAGQKKRARAEAEVRRVADERGYEVVGFFTKRSKHSGAASGFQDMTHATLRCGCGNSWDVRQDSLRLKGTGCPSCAEFGYDSSKPGAIYLLARGFVGVDQRAFGISNIWPRRTSGYEQFDWLTIDVMEFENGQEARDFETLIVREVLAVAGRSVEPDSVYYKNKEAFAEGHGIPMFNDVRFLISWAEARAGLREVAA